MKMYTNEAVGKLVLRLSLGLLILPHGIAKLVRGVDGIAENLARHGVPELAAYGVYVGEVIGPALLIIGFYSRVGAALIGVNMLVAIALVHAADIFGLARNGGVALELQYIYLFASVAVMLIGPGRHAINDR